MILGKIDYKLLRSIDPVAGRTAVLEYLKTNGGNISAAAEVFGINRPVVYDILKKEFEGDLSDRPKTPKHSPNKVSGEVEDKVIETKNKTRMGAKRLSVYLRKHENLTVPYGTIRHILSRNKDRIKYKKLFRKHEKREFVDWYSAAPFEIVQIDPLQLPPLPPSVAELT